MWWLMRLEMSCLCVCVCVNIELLPVIVYTHHLTLAKIKSPTEHLRRRRIEQVISISYTHFDAHTRTEYFSTSAAGEIAQTLTHTLLGCCADDGVWSVVWCVYMLNQH